MRPLLLKGHDRAITHLKFNNDGDLLFTCSKGTHATVWRSDNGERLGTYNGHTGAIWYLDVDYKTKHLLTGSADMSARLWNCKDGKELFKFEHKTPVRCVGFAAGDRQFLTVTDQVMGYKPKISIYNLADDIADQQGKACLEIEGSLKMKFTQAQWGPLNTRIYCSSDSGSMFVFDTETGKEVGSINAHDRSINRFVFSKDQTHFLTASHDQTCKLYDTSSLKLLKTYDIGRPNNTAALHPTRDHIAVGGGQDAVEVARTGGKTDQFKVRFFHKVYEDALGSLQGHFGPVHTMQYSPDGKIFASGGEDGYVRFHVLDKSYDNIDVPI